MYSTLLSSRKEALLSSFNMRKTEMWKSTQETCNDLIWFPKPWFLNLLKSNTTTTPAGISFHYITHLCGHIRTVFKNHITHNYFKRSSPFICFHYVKSEFARVKSALSQSGLAFNGPKCFSEPGHSQTLRFIFM